MQYRYQVLQHPCEPTKYKLLQVERVLQPVSPVASWAALIDLFNQLMEKSMCICLTSSSVGKSYRTRSGEILKITSERTGTVYRFVSEHFGRFRTFTAKGKFYDREDWQAPSDLMEEVCTVAGKSWDGLRTPTAACKGKIQSGEFRCKRNRELRVAYQNKPDHQIQLGSDDRQWVGIDAESARVLSGFFGELADQLEGK